MLLSMLVSEPPRSCSLHLEGSSCKNAHTKKGRKEKKKRKGKGKIRNEKKEKKNSHGYLYSFSNQ